MPTAEASQWVVLTAPKVPMISGRVVKRGPITGPPLTGVLIARCPR